MYSLGGTQTYELPKSAVSIRDVFRAVLGMKDEGVGGGREAGREEAHLAAHTERRRALLAGQALWLDGRSVGLAVA